MTWKQYKAIRKAYFYAYIFKNKLKVCVACNGTGQYDTTRYGKIPKCGSCEGTGKVREREVKPFFLFHRRQTINL